MDYQTRKEMLQEIRALRKEIVADREGLCEYAFHQRTSKISDIAVMNFIRRQEGTEIFCRTLDLGDNDSYSDIENQFKDAARYVRENVTGYSHKKNKEIRDELYIVYSYENQTNEIFICAIEPLEKYLNRLKYIKTRININRLVKENKKSRIVYVSKLLEDFAVCRMDQDIAGAKKVIKDLEPHMDVVHENDKLYKLYLAIMDLKKRNE
jgi:hypothetical protein